jgi:hypothetical protein
MSLGYVDGDSVLLEHLQQLRDFRRTSQACLIDGRNISAARAFRPVISNIWPPPVPSGTDAQFLGERSGSRQDERSNAFNAVDHDGMPSRKGQRNEP